MSMSDSDLEKFKRRLIKVVARMSNEGLSEEQLWKKLKTQTKANYRVLWTRMRSLVLKKLRLLFNVGDLCAKVPPVARMTFTDWLMFDLVLVNETIDMISLARVHQDESMEVSVPQPPHLWDLFHIVKRYGIEEAKGPDFVKAWVNLTKEYNAPSSGRQCSPMLLQLRWYLLKEKTRNAFYELWSKFNKLSNRPNKDELNKITPNELYSAIAKAYPKIVTKPFVPWNKLLEIGRVVNPLQFQKKIKGGVNTEDETPLSKVSGDTPTTGDVEVIEPQIETITLDDDSDDQLDHVKVTAKKTSTSQNKGVAPPTSKGKDVIPSTTKHMDLAVISPSISKDIEVISHSNSKDQDGVLTTSKHMDSEVISPSTSKDVVISPSTSKDVEVISSSTSKDVEVISPSASKGKDGVLTISKDKWVTTSSSLKNKDGISQSTLKNIITPTTSKDKARISSSSAMNKAVITPSTSKDIIQSKDVISSSISKFKEVIRPSTSKHTTNQEKGGTSIDITEDFVVTTDFDDTVDYNVNKDLDDINDCVDISDAEAEIAQQEDDIRVDAETLQAFCGEQYIVNSFDDCDIDQELIDNKPVVVPEVDGLSSVKIIRTTHVEDHIDFSLNQSTKTQSFDKNLASNALSDQPSKSVNETSEIDGIVSNLLEQEISRYSVVNSIIKIEEPDIREELKRQGKEDMLKIISDTSREVVFDIIDYGIECDDDGIECHNDDGVDDNNDSDDEPDSDDSAFKIDRKLLLYPIVYTVKLDDMNALRKRKDFNRVTTQKLIENVFKESKVETKTNEEKLKEIVTEKECQRPNYEETLPEVKTEIQDNQEEYDDPITVLPIKETFNKTEESNSEIVRMLQEPIKFPKIFFEEPTEPPIKRIKISHHLFNKPKLRTYSPIQLCKNPDFNTRLKKINTGILVYQVNRNKLLDCKPLTIDLDKGFERKLVDNTVYLNTEEKRAENTSTSSELLIKEKTKRSDAEDSLLKLLLEKDASVYVRKPAFEEQELLSARKCKTINLPDIDQVRKLNQRLLTAEVTPISFGIKQNDCASETLENYITAPKESPSISPGEAPISDKKDPPIVESEENLTVIGPDKIPMTVKPAETPNNFVSEESNTRTKPNENNVIVNEHTITEIKQEKQEPEKPNRFKSVENELTKIELATKDTLPDIEIIESASSATKQIKRRLSQPKQAKSIQPYTPAWCRPVQREPLPGLVTNDTLLKMLKYIHGEDEDCVIVPPTIQESEIQRKKKKKASQQSRKKSGLSKTIKFYNGDDTASKSSEDELPLPVPSTSSGKKLKTTEPRSKMYISNDPNPNVHPQLSSFCCWIKEIEYRINLPDFNLDSVPHPCLYFDFGVCTCCCREGNSKDKIAIEQQNSVTSPALKITITPAYTHVPKTSRNKSALQMFTSKESIAIQTDLPTNTKSQMETATVETSQTVPRLFLKPASIGLESSSEIIGILTADELAYLQGKREHPLIKVTAGHRQQKKYIISNNKAPIVRNKIPAKLQTGSGEDCIVLSDDEDEKDKSSNLPHLVIDGVQSLNNAPLTVTSGSSKILVEKRTPCPQQPTRRNQTDKTFKKTIRHVKNKEAPLDLGQNKVLLTTTEIPAYLNNVSINYTKNNDNDIPVQQFNSTVTAPLINLPKGVAIVLMPDNTLSLSIAPGTTILESELEHMPTLLSLVQKQLGQLGVTPTIINTISTVNKEISLLSDDENSVDKTIETENNPQQVSKSNEVEKSLETEENDYLSEKDVSVNKEASNIYTNANTYDSNDTTKNISLHCSEQLPEHINDTQIPNLETSLDKEYEPTSSDLNTSQAVTDLDLQEKEKTQSSKNIQKNSIEGPSKETTASPNQTLTREEKRETLETSPTKSFLKVKDFAAVNKLDVDAPLDADSSQIKKTILSDLMEMSGISSEDTVPLMPATLDVVSLVPETPENLLTPVMPSNSGNLTPLMPITPGDIIPLVAPATPDISRLELNPVFTIKALRYSHHNNGKFYVLDLKTGSIVPLKVSINKTKKVVAAQSNQMPTPKRTAISNGKEKVKTKIDLVDSDAPMEEEYLVDSDDSNDTPTQTQPKRNIEVISSPSISQLKAISCQKSLLLKHTGEKILPNRNRFVYTMEPDSANPDKVKTKLLPRILCNGPLRRTKTRRIRKILLTGKMLKLDQKTSNSTLKNNMPNTSSESPSDDLLTQVIVSEDTTEDAPDIFNENLHNKVDLEEDEAEKTPADKDYFSSDDEPLSILKDRREKTKRTYTKRPLEVDGEDGPSKRVKTNEVNKDSIESSNIAEQTETCGVQEKVAFTEETQKEGEEVNNELNSGFRTEEEELEIFENSNNDGEMEASPSPSCERPASELDDEDFILGA